MNQTTPFGTDASFQELADRIRGFSHDDASPSEQAEMVKACKLLAEETVARWETVLKLERELREKITMADIRGLMSEVLIVTGEGNEVKDDLRRLRAPITPTHEPFGMPMFMHSEPTWKQAWRGLCNLGKASAGTWPR